MLIFGDDISDTGIKGENLMTLANMIFFFC